MKLTPIKNYTTDVMKKHGRNRQKFRLAIFLSNFIFPEVGYRLVFSGVMAAIQVKTSLIKTMIRPCMVSAVLKIHFSHLNMIFDNFKASVLIKTNTNFCTFLWTIPSWVGVNFYKYVLVYLCHRFLECNYYHGLLEHFEKEWKLFRRNRQFLCIIIRAMSWRVVDWRV